MVRRFKREQSTRAGDWLVGRRTRILRFFAVLLVFAVSRPSAAQFATPSFADLGRYLPPDATFATAGVSSTPSNAPAGLVQAAGESEAPVASLGALSSRVKPFETIYVRTVSGEEMAGTFSRASEASLTMEVNGQTRDLPASDVQRVWRRGGNRVKQGMLFGFLAGAAIADIAAITSSSGSDSSFGAGLFVGTVAGGGAGLIWGALIGAFVHERPLVYRAASPTVRVMPVLAPDRVGLMASVHF